MLQHFERDNAIEAVIRERQTGRVADCDAARRRVPAGEPVRGRDVDADDCRVRERGRDAIAFVTLATADVEHAARRRGQEFAERALESVDVAPLSLRAGVLVSSVAPRTTAKLQRRLGSDRIAAQMADAQRDKR